MEIKKQALPQKINSKIEEENKRLRADLIETQKNAFAAIEKITTIQESFDKRLAQLEFITVKFKKLNDKAVIPKQAYKDDAGFDLTTVKRTKMSKGKVEYKFGLACEIPNGFVGLIFPRSSIYKKNLSLSNAVGVIDSGYRGEIKAIFNTVSDLHGTNMYAEGERACQMLIVKLPKVKIVESDKLSDTDRGDGGFGSSN